jgi:CBS domain containing-hemolysin-like protein
VNEQNTEIEPSTLVIAGGLAVRDLNRRLKTSVPESEAYTTIGGFLMTEAGHVLKPGEVVKYDGLVFHVERVEKRRVMRVKLEILQTNGEGEPQDELDRAGSGA